MEKKWEDINDPAFDEIVEVNIDADAYANRDEETEEELEARDAFAEQEERRGQALARALAEFSKLRTTNRPC